ncbi:MAG: pseudouridine synthase [Bilifractor sp.]
MRINKYLSACGFCSRREADRLLEAGHVTINGEKAETGSQVSDGDVVLVYGKRAALPQQKTYLKLYKPAGIVCTFEKREKNNLGDYLRDYLKVPQRVTYAGRLDKNSEGLLILTDDGDLIQEMMAARNSHEKEYAVTVDRDLTEQFLAHMRSGVYLPELDTTTRPCRVEQTGRRTFRIILTQGLNRQIRRMCRVLGYEVKTLKRVRVVNILLDGMKSGELVHLTTDEIASLKAALRIK